MTGRSVSELRSAHAPGGQCAWVAQVAHDVLDVELVDLPCFGRRTRLVWSKQRWRCRNPNCEVVTFIELDDRIAAKRAGITDRAGRWATFQVGHHGRALIDEPNRIGQVTAVGLDEILFCRDGPFEHRLVRCDLLGDVGSVWPVSQSVRHDAARGRPDRRSVSCGETRELRT
jgi:hypothetical protein